MSSHKGVVSLFGSTIPTHSELKEAYTNCQKCGLCQLSTQRVMWSGPDISQLMVIGEGPGADEDRTGVPFCGRAGQRWDQLLAKVRITRSMVHVSNTVWCRPTDGNKNLPPQAEHIKACSDRLQNEIALVRPRVIVCLGKIATFAILNTVCGLDVSPSTAMGKLRKRWIDTTVAGLDVIVKPTWHPAYELRTTQAGRFGVNHEMLADWTEIARVVPEVCH